MMDSSESISFSMDTTSDSIDVRNHFHSTTAKPSTTNRENARHSPKKHARMLLREHNNETYDGDADDDEADQILIHKRPPDKVIVVDETPPPSTASSSSSSTSSTSSSQSSTTSTIYSDCPIASVSQPIIYHHEETIKEETLQSVSASTTPAKSKKSVLFNNVTVYHFNRSQGFNSIPSIGGSTLGMKRKHFLRRRLSVDLYEEVRRRSRRDILLRIKAEKRRKEDKSRLEQQRLLNERLKVESNSTSSASNTNTSDSDDNEKAQDDDLDVDDDEFYSDFSDISDSDLEGDKKIFLPAISAKMRRTLLRACGVSRIDPGERKECKKIRESRNKSGCECVGSCLPQYCQCIRLGINCYVDQANFPCGCAEDGCRNPEGRIEFNRDRVRDHFRDKVLNGNMLISESSSDFVDTEQSHSPPPVVSEMIC